MNEAFLTNDTARFSIFDTSFSLICLKHEKFTIFKKLITEKLRAIALKLFNKVFVWKNINNIYVKTRVVVPKVRKLSEEKHSHPPTLKLVINTIFWFMSKKSYQVWAIMSQNIMMLAQLELPKKR